MEAGVALVGALVERSEGSVLLIIVQDCCVDITWSLHIGLPRYPRSKVSSLFRTSFFKLRVSFFLWICMMQLISEDHGWYSVSNVSDGRLSKGLLRHSMSLKLLAEFVSFEWLLLSVCTDRTSRSGMNRISSFNISLIEDSPSTWLGRSDLLALVSLGIHV